jgi:hypothetical protein
LEAFSKQLIRLVLRPCLDLASTGIDAELMD